MLKIAAFAGRLCVTLAILLGGLPGGSTPVGAEERDGAGSVAPAAMLDGNAVPAAKDRIADTLEQSGEGWRELTPNGAAGAPGRRYLHTATWDGQSSRLLVFGGASFERGRVFTSFGDLWEHTTTGGWRQLTANGVTGAPAARIEHTATWDPHGSRLLVFGGAGRRGLTNDLWEYTAANGWRQLTADGAAGAPARRSRHSAVWDARAARLLVFGGNGGCGGFCNDLWQYTESGGWQPASGLGASGAPAGRHSHNAVWDTAAGRMLVLGGLVEGGRLGPSFSQELWEYTANGAWRLLSGSGTALARTPNSTTWDANANRILVFAGACGVDCYNDLWEYTATGGWRQLTADGAAGSPRRRVAHATAWDGQAGRLLVFGGAEGDGSDVILNDLWEYRARGPR
ncbi:MAG: hypothetical protein HY329_02600 [Chloroflexi bacterium]|nr:hypothetical protein [Chloroflexota bacterium]